MPDRVHMLPYVPHWQVVAVPVGGGRRRDPDPPLAEPRDRPDHQVLRVLARPAAAGRQRRARRWPRWCAPTGQGEVFTAEDVADYVRAVKAVLADPEQYRDAYDDRGLLDEWTWEAQAEVLDGVYTRVLAEAVPQQGRRAGDSGGGMSGRPDVTVVVAVYNTMPYLTECLNSLVGQTHRSGPAGGRRGRRRIDRRQRRRARPVRRAVPGHRQGHAPGQLRRPGRAEQPGPGGGHRPVRLLHRFRRLPRRGSAGAHGGAARTSTTPTS